MDNSITEVPPALVSRTRTREAPWLGIGVSGEWDDYREALRDAELDFEVEQKQLYWNRDSTVLGSGMGMPVWVSEPAPMFANVRKTDGKLLGCVTPQYQVVQNVDAFKILEPLTAAGGIITHAGMTEQGLVFMVMRMGSNLVLGDFYEFDVMCCNSFNTRFPLSLVMTPMRIICQNMYRKLMGGKDCLLRVRHMSKAPDRLKMAARAVGGIGSYMTAFGLTLEQARSNALSPAHFNDMVEYLFPYPKPGGERELMSRERIDAMRTEFVEKYYNASDNVKFHGTGMGFLNAYFDYLTHRDPGKVMPGSWDDRRFSQLVAGDVVKAKLIQEAIG